MIPTPQTERPNRPLRARKGVFNGGGGGKDGGRIPIADRHFIDGDLTKSHFVACLSAILPPAEEYFIRVVRAHRSQITDDALRREVSGFIGQETLHGKEHHILNEHLAKLGYPAPIMERATRKLLKVPERILSPQTNLAITASFEHVTATLAELVLTDAEIQSYLNDDWTRRLLLWHAVEEAEHKNVVFDLYREVGGSEKVRVRTMRSTRIGLAVATTVFMGLSLATDSASYRPATLVRSIRGFWRSPLMSNDVMRALRRYDSPLFHPSETGGSEIFEPWLVMFEPAVA